MEALEAGGDDTIKELQASLSGAMGLLQHTSPEESRVLLQAATKFICAAKTFPFLKLPVELRNRIYEQVLTIISPLLPSTCMHAARLSAEQPAITKVCRRNRTEALSLFYSLNRFEIHIHGCDFGYLINYMDMIGEENRKHLKHLTVTLKDRWTCGNGLLDFVRWCANAESTNEVALWHDTNEWTDETNEDWTPEDREELEVGGTPYMTQTTRAFDDAITLGSNLCKYRPVSETRLRKAFDDWLDESAFRCKCAQSANKRRSALDGVCSKIGRVTEADDDVAEDCSAGRRR